MQPVTLPFGAFGALAGFAAYGVLRLVKDLRAGRSGFEDVSAEDMLDIVKRVRDLCQTPAESHIHLVT